MSRRLLAKTSVDGATLILSVTNITTSAWVTLIASTRKGCTALEVINPTNAVLQLAIGSAGNEVALPFFIPPGDTAQMIPYEIAGRTRISAKAVDITADNQTLVINLYG